MKAEKRKKVITGILTVVFLIVASVMIFLFWLEHPGQLVRNLRDRDPAVRDEAVAAVAEAGPDAVDAVAEVLSTDPYPPARQAAARALGEISSPLGINPLIGALSDPHEEVRREAVIALVKIGSEPAIPVIITATGNERATAVASVLYYSGHPRLRDRGEQILRRMGLAPADVEDSGIRWPGRDDD